MGEAIEAQAKPGGARTPPRPNRRLRTTTLAVMTAAALAAALLAFSIHREALYAAGEAAPTDVGPFVDADVAAHDNAYVRVGVTLEPPAAEFRRPLEPSHFRVAKAGADRWVIYAVPDGFSEQRFLPPRLVAGRLSKASDLGVRFGDVAATTGPDAWVVVDGDDPHGATWILGLLALLGGFLLFNVGGIARVLRPVR